MKDRVFTRASIVRGFKNALTGEAFSQRKHYDPLPRGERTSFGKIEQRTLHNGLKLLAAHLPAARSLVQAIGVKAGAHFESPHQKGLFHLLEHLQVNHMPTPMEFLRKLREKGDAAHFYTGARCTTYSIKLSHSPASMALEKLDLLSSRNLISQEVFEKERQVVFNEMVMSDLRGYERALNSRVEHLHTWLSPKSLHRIPTLGTRETVSNLTLEELSLYRDATYQPGNMLGVIVGNFTNQDLEAFEEMLSSKKVSCSPMVCSLIPDVDANLPQFRGPRTLLEHHPLSQNYHVELFLPAVSKLDLRFPVFQALTGSIANRLKERLRVKEGQLYSIDSSFYGTFETGYFRVCFSVENERQLNLVTRSVGDELRQLSQNPLNLSELSSHRYSLRAALEGERFNAESLSANFIDQLSTSNSVVLPEERVRLVEEVTGERVAAVTSQLWKPGSGRLVVSGATSRLRAQSLEALLDDVGF